MPPTAPSRGSTSSEAVIACSDRARAEAAAVAAAAAAPAASPAASPAPSAAAAGAAAAAAPPLSAPRSTSSAFTCTGSWLTAIVARTPRLSSVPSPVRHAVRHTHTLRAVSGQRILNLIRQSAPAAAAALVAQRRAPTVAPRECSGAILTRCAERDGAQPHRIRPQRGRRERQRGCLAPPRRPHRPHERPQHVHERHGHRRLCTHPTPHGDHPTRAITNTLAPPTLITECHPTQCRRAVQIKSHAEPSVAQ